MLPLLKRYKENMYPSLFFIFNKRRKKLMLFLTLNSDGTGVVSDNNPIQTKHSSDGEEVITSAYITNNGKRANVANDTNPPPLIYTNIQIKLQGVAYTLAQAVDANISSTILVFDNIAGWNIGTIIKLGSVERCRIEEIVSNTSIRVTRNYTADGKSSTIAGHSIGEIGTAETTSVCLALPDPNDTTYNTVGTFLAGGTAIATGIDPTILTQAIDNLDTSNIIKSNSGLKYTVNSIIKIDNEQMKVIAVAGNDIQVIRGYNSTTRASHTANTIIYCVGVVDITPVTHKIFIKNDPPAGLPTQKKKDIKIVIVADEEPL
jgi:hypothetical protein